MRRKNKVQKTSIHNNSINQSETKKNYNVELLPSVLLQHIFSFLIMGSENPNLLSLTSKNFRKVTDEYLKIFFRIFDMKDESDKIEFISMMRNNNFIFAKNILKIFINFPEDDKQFSVRTEEKKKTAMTNVSFQKYLEEQTINQSFKKTLSLVKADQSLIKKIQKISHEHSSRENNIYRLSLVCFTGGICSLGGLVASAAYGNDRMLFISLYGAGAFLSGFMSMFGGFSINRTCSRYRSKRTEENQLPNLIQEQKALPLTDQEKILQGNLRLLKWYEHPNLRPSYDADLTIRNLTRL